MTNHVEYEAHPDFELLDFTFATIGNPKVENGKGEIRVPIRDVHIEPGFHGHDNEIIVSDGDLILTGVVSSLRTLYIEEQDRDDPGWKNEINDGPFPSSDGKIYTVDIQVPTHDPIGWVGWTIDCRTVSVEIRQSRLPKG